MNISKKEVTYMRKKAKSLNFLRAKNLMMIAESIILEEAVDIFPEDRQKEYVETLSEENKYNMIDILMHL